MKTLKTATILLAFVAMACTGEKQAPVSERIVEDVDPKTGIISLRKYTLSDTITIGGKLYNYSCTFEPVDSMPVLMNPQGLEYHESRVGIKIWRDDNKVFSKTFYKSNFCDHVPDEFLKTDHSAFYFIITVGDPDETSDNMAYPLELKVATDGSFTVKKAENLETEPLHPGLNIDPSEDAV